MTLEAYTYANYAGSINDRKPMIMTFPNKEDLLEIWRIEGNPIILVEHRFNINMLEAMRVPFRDNLHLCNIINFFTKDEVVVAEMVREFWRNVFEKDRITRIMLGIQVTIDVSHVTSIA